MEGMARSILLVTIASCVACTSAGAQTAPKDHAKIWLPAVGPGPARSTTLRFTLDSTKTYTLSELVDVAEEHNPETRVAWEQAKRQAAAVGIARSALFPILAAKAVGEGVRQRVLLNTEFLQQTLGLFQSTVSLVTPYS